MHKMHFSHIILLRINRARTVEPESKCESHGWLFWGSAAAALVVSFNSGHLLNLVISSVGHNEIE